MRYRSKPQEVEAIQWTGDNRQEIHDFLGDKCRFDSDSRYGWDLKILAGKDGAQKWVPVPLNHWTVRPPGDESDVWPIDPDYFAAKYEPAEVT